MQQPAEKTLFHLSQIISRALNSPRCWNTSLTVSSCSALARTASNWPQCLGHQFPGPGEAGQWRTGRWRRREGGRNTLYWQVVTHLHSSLVPGVEGGCRSFWRFDCDALVFFKAKKGALKKTRPSHCSVVICIHENPHREVVEMFKVMNRITHA